jgi:hypothetical protein
MEALVNVGSHLLSLVIEVGILEESATTSNFTKTTQLLQVLSRVMCKK